MGRRRRAIADQVRDHEGLSGLTQKFTIHCRDGECDFYLKVAWTPSGIKITKIGKVLKPVHHGRRLAYVDLTAAGSQRHNIRALIELACKEAYALLRHGAWTTDKLVREWRGYPFEPSGYCPQVEGLVRSPMDAAARLIEKRRSRWEKSTP